MGRGFVCCRSAREPTRPKAEFAWISTEIGLAKGGSKAIFCGVDTKREEVLPFGELEALAGALLTVLLPLMSARIARKQTEPFQLTAQLGIEFNQCPGYTESCCPGLTANPAAIGKY